MNRQDVLIELYMYSFQDAVVGLEKKMPVGLEKKMPEDGVRGAPEGISGSLLKALV